MKSTTIAALSLLLAIGSAMADDPIHGLQSKQDFITMKAQVTKDFAGGDKYKEIAPDDQKTVLTALDRMDGRWQHANAAGQLDPTDEAAQATDQEVVTGILTHASAESRVVCERYMPTNSHLAKTVCETVAQKRRDAQNAKDVMKQGD